MENYKVRQRRSSEQMRLDSVENKKVLIATARKLFKQKGVEVPLIEIAKAAGVSRMTFYRNFPNRSAIIEAVFDYNLQSLSAFSERFKDSHNCFFSLLDIVLKQRVEYNLFLPYISESKMKIHAEQIFKIFTQPIENAKDLGMLRSDFDGKKDLILLILMMGGAAAQPYEFEKKGNFTIERAMDLIMNGIKA